MNQDSDLSSAIALALQLWTVRELAERDMTQALAAVAGLGYTAVEFAGFGVAGPSAIRVALAANGLHAVSAHVQYDALSGDLAGVMRDLHLLGCTQATAPAFAKQLYRTTDDAKRLAESLNLIAARLRDEGIAFAYHNEADDFSPLGQTTLWRALVDHTDPALVKLQLDVFTAVQMNQDVVGLMGEQTARITSLHVCDKRGEHYVPIGQGELDWPAIIAAARTTACQWLIVEHDAPPNPLVDAKASLDALSRLNAHVTPASSAS